MISTPSKNKKILLTFFTYRRNMNKKLSYWANDSESKYLLNFISFTKQGFMDSSTSFGRSEWQRYLITFLPSMKHLSFRSIIWLFTILGIFFLGFSFSFATSTLTQIQNIKNTQWTQKEHTSTASERQTGTLQKNINFLVLWDWGTKWSKHQKEVAKEMKEYSSKNPVDFVVTTWDNFYQRGVTWIDDEHWKKSFTDVYDLTYTWAPARYPVLWNHDHFWNYEAQVQYSKVNSIWKMENKYYTKELTFGTPKKTVQFIFLDTTPFDIWRKKDITPQLDWLDAMLSKSTADFKIVVGHHPAFTSGLRKWKLKHIQKILQPIFEKYTVDLYLAGHEHDLEYDKPEGFTNYFVSGAGSEKRRIHTPNPETRFIASDYWFFAFTLENTKIEVQCINAKGKILYSTSIKK